MMAIMMPRDEIGVGLRAGTACEFGHVGIISLIHCAYRGQSAGTVLWVTFQLMSCMSTLGTFIVMGRSCSVCVVEGVMGGELGALLPPKPPPHTHTRPHPRQDDERPC